MTSCTAVARSALSPNVLLDLVQHQERAGQLPVGADEVQDRIAHLIVGEVALVPELGVLSWPESSR